jgi:hypothetical protein
MRSKGLVVAIFLMASTLLQAQDQYVEITVKDTLMVEPAEWFYYIRVNDSYGDINDMLTTIDTVEYTTTPKTKKVGKAKVQAPAPKVETREEKLAQLKTIILANGGHILASAYLKDYFSSLDQYMLSRTRFYLDDDYGVFMRFGSRDSLKQFLAAIQDNDMVEGGVLRINHPQLQSYYDILDAKLIDAGRLKAGRLAQLSGRKLGTIMQVTESSEVTKNVLEDLFERFITLVESKSYSSRKSKDVLLLDKIKIEKTLKLRFAFQ